KGYVHGKGVKLYLDVRESQNKDFSAELKGFEDDAKKKGQELSSKGMSLEDEISMINGNMAQIKNKKSKEYKTLAKEKGQKDKAIMEINDQMIDINEEFEKAKRDLQTKYTQKVIGFTTNYKKEKIAPAVMELRQQYGGILEDIEELEKSQIVDGDSLKNLKEKSKKKGLTAEEKDKKEELEEKLPLVKEQLRISRKFKKYFDKLEDVLVKDARALMKEEDIKLVVQSSPMGGMMGGMPFTVDQAKYEVKLLNYVDEEQRIKGIPVIFEVDPTMENLFGKVEPAKGANPMMAMGGPAPEQDHHTRMDAGSLVKANGGYLILNLMESLEEQGTFPFAKLTKDLYRGKTKVEDMIKQIFMRSPTSEDIDLDLKVIMAGMEQVYQELKGIAKNAGFFEKFDKTFNTKAQFSPVTYNTEENRKNYSKFIAAQCDKEGLKHLDCSALTEVFDIAAKESGRKDTLTTKTDRIVHLLRESNKEADGKYITNKDIKSAVKAKIERHNLSQELYIDYIRNGTIVINTDGEKVGQINGLAVYGMQDLSFGIPSKITVTSSKGKKGVVSIDRSAGTTGSSFDKSIDSITNALTDLFAQDKELALNAAISFEQNYGGLDGDSATLAMYLGLMSKLSGFGIDQGIAVTGSMDQQRESVQAIGGVTEKVEGFYKICKGRGLTGEQGAIIPEINIPGLILSEEIIEDIEKGKFHLYPVEP
ncbi:MAG: AAA family ATPase, partial [Nanoarchaeota archaeon]|nr:AAA family ATPase [Nanoarchaeota archaeon]